MLSAFATQYTAIHEPAGKRSVLESSLASVSCVTMPPSYRRISLTLVDFPVPPAEEARRRLIAKVSNLPLIQQRAVRGTSAFLLYYSYALMEKALIVELEKVGSVFQYLFGVMGDLEGADAGCEAFEGMFEVHKREGSRSSLGARTDDGSDSDSSQ